MDAITLETLEHIVGGTRRARSGEHQPLGDEPLGRIVTDRRAVRSGDVFWALDDREGSESARAWEACARGAAGVVAGAGRTEPCGDAWLLEVDDATSALMELARWQRSGFHGAAIGVAGAVGKTITRDLIETILGRRRPGVVATIDVCRADLATALLDLDARCDHAVFEFAARAAETLREQATLVAPHFGVVTHTDGSVERYAALLERLPVDGLAVLNGDDIALRRAASRSRAQALWVGRRPDCDLVATRVRADGGTLNFQVDGCEICLPVWGRHYLTSALLAIGVGRAMGHPMREIATALADFDPPPMRCQVLDRGGVRIVHDALDATPTSMHAALEVLRECNPRGRRFVVCGDLDDARQEPEQLHRRLGGEVVTVCGADVLVACGSHAADVTDGARAAGMPARSTFAFRESAEAIPSLRSTLRAGDVVLWKDSRDAALARLLEALDGSRPARRMAA